MIPLRTNIPYGFCQCGCGEKTNIADRTSRRIGWVEGEPIRFIVGHANRIHRPDFSAASPFKIEGVYCKLLPLTRGLFAIIDAADYDWLSRWHWYAIKARNGFYAVRHALTKKKITGKHVYLHRFILGLKDSDERQGDHRNGVTLDHRRKNLRPASEEENKRNCKMHRTNTSGRKGVYYDKIRKKWVAQIKFENKTIMLGRFSTFEEACAVREAAEKKYHGDFARLQ
jgi:AP2 domain